VVDAEGDEMAVSSTRRRFTLAEYHRMGEVGILADHDRVELIEGEIVEMTPIGPAHASVVARLVRLWAARLQDRAVLWPQNPLTLPGQASELQPDLALLQPRPDFYRSSHPGGADTLLAFPDLVTTVDDLLG
jgi:Uma2 family endonuclease